MSLMNIRNNMGPTPEHSSLGNTTYDQSKKGKCALNYNRLGPVSDERFYPLYNLWMDAKECKFLYKELAVYLFESLSLIKEDGLWSQNQNFG